MQKNDLKLRCKKQSPQANLVWLILLALFGMILNGCWSTSLPQKLAGDELLTIKQAAERPIIVGVSPYKYPVYSDDLIKQLRRTALFEQVDYIKELTDRPHIVARIDNNYGPHAEIPIVFLYTLGIVPTVHTQQSGLGFSFWLTDGSRNHIQITAAYEQTSIGGWYALLKNISPNWTVHPDPLLTKRYRNLFKLKVIEALDEHDLDISLQSFKEEGW